MGRASADHPGWMSNWVLTVRGFHVLLMFSNTKENFEVSKFMFTAIKKGSNTKIRRYPPHRAALGGVHTLDSESLKEFAPAVQPSSRPRRLLRYLTPTIYHPRLAVILRHRLLLVITLNLASVLSSSAAQSGRMKGGFNGLKGKQISLITIVLMSTAILLWTWEKTPLLTTLVPAETETWLQVSSGCSPGISLSELKEVANIVGEEASNLEERTSVDRRHGEKAEENNSDLQKPIDPAYTNISVGGNLEDKLTTPMESPGRK